MVDPVYAENIHRAECTCFEPNRPKDYVVLNVIWGSSLWFRKPLEGVEG